MFAPYLSFRFIRPRTLLLVHTTYYSDPDAPKPNKKITPPQPSQPLMTVTFRTDTKVGVMEMVEFTSGGSGIEGRIGADYTSPPAFSVSNYRSISVSTAGITEETPSEDGGQGDEECGRTDRKVRGERNVLPTTTTSSFDLSRQSSTLPEAGLSADPSLGGALIDVKLNPIYFLFVAPPAAASIAWSRLSGDFDVIAKSFFFTSGFLYVLIAIFNLNFLRKAPFNMAWWAYTFPCKFSSEVIMMREIEQAGDVVRLSFVPL